MANIRKSARLIFGHHIEFPCKRMHKIRTHHRHPQGRIFSWMVLLLGFSVGLILPILPNFIKTIVGTDSSVSIFYSAMALVMFMGAIISTYIFKKVPRTSITKWAFVISGVVSIAFILTTDIVGLSITNTLRVWMRMFLIMALALFIRDFTNKCDLGKEEGHFYLFHNIGNFLGPLIGGFVAAYMGYETVFILASLAFFVAFFYFYHKHIIQKHPAINRSEETSDHHILKNAKRFFANKERVKAYFITVVYMMWIGFKRIYIPLYIIFEGYKDSMTGLVMALGIIPLMVLEVKAGEYADKKGVRKPISYGFLIIGLSLIAVFFSPYPLLNFLIIILSNIGAALVEPLQEYYILENMPKEEEDDLYGIFMTADPVGHFLTPAIGVLTFIFFPIKAIFLVFGIFVLFSGLFTWLSVRH